MHFVTRLKEKAAYEVLGTQAAKGKNVLSDEATVFRQQATAKNESFFRVVRYWDKTTHHQFQFLTNHHDLSAETIAAIYKERWQVELFLKALKQNLRIKSFVGNSANALKTQTWTALIARLLVRFLGLKIKLSWHLSRFTALLRQQRFVYHLWLFLDRPFEGPSGTNLEEQLPPPLAAALFEIAANTEPQPESAPMSESEAMIAGVPTTGCG